jgi:hypothetical protein
MLGGESIRTQKFSILGLLFVSLSMVGLAATASTPDGGTPETVCDPLKADNVTQGLYGLCLAFCEAQDIADEELPITDDELAALAGTPPSGSILNSYNMIKKTTDPNMPCIVVDSTCPCWTDEELAWIDGTAPDGMNMADTLCVQLTDPQGMVDRATAIEVDNTVLPLGRIGAAAGNKINPNGNIQRCSYSNTQVTPGISRLLDAGQGTLTPGQAAVCLEEVIARCAMLGY